MATAETPTLANDDMDEERPRSGSLASTTALSHQLSLSALPDELARRLDLVDQVKVSELVDGLQLVHAGFFTEVRHDIQGDDADKSTQSQGIVSKWRQKERLKTTAVALVLCLNIGVDPPDVIKISPCARLECWVDPLSMQPPKALDTIGKNLQAQYERWQPRAKYKMHLDPTMDDVKKLAVSSRRAAKNERVLFHYNGHGVPRPTVNGEIWVFNKSYTQYIPMSIYDLQAWLGTPCIFVFDCSAAGLIVNSFKAFAEQKTQEIDNGEPPCNGVSSGYAGGPHTGSPQDGLSDCILLAACGANELLPQSPHVPADVFTACLTTPIKVALRWFCSRSLMRQEGLTKELIDRIPGKQTDRKTPLGELNWIFTAITDTIAWNMLPRSLFQRLFRQDLLVASLFRNFLLAERIMRASACCPISYPRLPPTHHHPMWQAWDMAAEMCLLQLPDMLESEVEVEFQPSPFFNEQLTAFELWLEHGSDEKKPPEQLPIVLQVLLSQVHRLRALVLLGRFLDMGRWAVDLALSVGIFPYVLKLLQTTAPDLRQTLVFIWTKILALDKTCQVDLVKDSGQQYFIHYLDSNDSTSSTDSRAQAAFVLAVICDGHPRGQSLAAGAGLLGVCLSHLRHSMASLSGGASGALLLIKWLCLCLGKLCQDMPEVTAMALRERVPEQLAGLLTASHPELRAAAVFTLGALVQVSDNESGPLSGVSEQDRLAAERAIACQLLPVTYDGSPLVRAELAAALARLATGHVVLFKDAVHEQQRNAAQILRGASPGSGPEAGPGSAPGNTGPRSAPSGGGPSSVPAMERASSSLDEASKSEGNGHVDTGVSSPGVQTSATGTFSPLLSVSIAAADGSIHSPLDAGSYASADAARVGGGLYKHLLQAACTLATDPAPKVARLGKAALRVADVELAPVSVNAGQLSSANSASVPSRMHSMVSNSSFLGLPSSLSMSRASSQALAPHTSTHPSQPQPSASKWRSLAWRTSSRSLASSASISSSPSSPSLPNLPPDALTRKPFVLRMVNGENMGRAPSIDAAQSSSRTPSMSRMHSLYSSASGPNAAGTSSQLQQHDEDSAGSSLHGPTQTADTPLPPSPVYKDSCEHFSWPLLEPQASLWRAEATHQGWLGGCIPPDPTKMASRMREKEQSIQRCAQLGSGARLKDNVHTIDSEAGSTVALLLHPFRPLVTSIDGSGTVRVHNYRHSTVINRFHVTGEGAAERKGEAKAMASVTFLHQLNEVQDGLLLAGTADGALRVWRNYAHKAEQRLATAWQAVPVAQAHSSQYYPQQAVFALNEASGRLYAAGGAAPSTVHTWDMSQECCTQQTHVSGSDDDDMSRDGGGVQHLAVARQEPLMLAGSFNGLVQLYDLRQSQKAAASVQPHRTPMLGMVLEPGGLSNQLVTGTSWGELKFIDFRMVGSTGQTGVWKTVEAHSKGAMSAMAAHPYSSLLATATATQVLKLWSPRGEQQGVIRATAPFLAQRVGPVNCLEFHPYRLLLASGGGDPIIALYPIVSASAEHTAAPAASTGSPGPVLTTDTDSCRPKSAS